MADLRFGALMTSKWLSFGRVLFSPVHFQLKDVNEDRVLVIDGTGKDWSFYCALTYDKAAVYDLGPAPSSPPSTTRKSALPNHRHIRHASLTDPLPYPENFFACVVLRFPPAQAPSTHAFVLAEAKRVLRPGGFLEFSVLDLDLANMGNCARRAVRQLKMDLRRADDAISLRNMGDELLAGLARERFAECKSCRVGVPVAGALGVRSPVGESGAAVRADTGLDAAALPRPEPSFSDLLNAPAPSAATASHIADKVSRVGRWWYSRCYESVVTTLDTTANANTADVNVTADVNTDVNVNALPTSIWSSAALVAECEARGTAFRLLVGYARKADVGVRRHVSV